MKVLFIGGTGLISTAVSELAIQKGFDLTLMNRGQRLDGLSKKVERIHCDIYDLNAVQKALVNRHFDAIVDWIAFVPEHVERDYKLFKGHTDQFVFISSASAYQKPTPKLPITEKEVPLDNPFWEYSKNKQRCEEYLLSLKDDQFPVTIIRPSHTYNEQSVVSQLNSWPHPYTLIHRMKQNKPVIIADQGQSSWTLTYNKDFAHAFLDILGNPKTYGEVYHLTSDKSYNWLEIHSMLEEAIGVKSEKVFVPTKEIVEVFPEYKGALLGDMMGSALFDNSKIKEVVPNYLSKTEYRDIAKKVVQFYESHPEYQTIDENFNQRYDQLVEAYRFKGRG